MPKALTKKKTAKKIVLPKNPTIMDFFGICKGIYGDGLKYQKSIRKWGK